MFCGVHRTYVFDGATSFSNGDTLVSALAA
jgi:hypothetical protein